MKYYKEDDVLPAILISMLIASFITLALHHKNETAALRRTIQGQEMALQSTSRTINTAIVGLKASNKIIQQQDRHLSNLRKVLQALTEPVIKYNDKGERI
jgi:uncharacterized protein (DUF3084 family)